MEPDHQPVAPHDIASPLGAESGIATTSGRPAFTHLVAIVVHGHQAEQMVHVPTLAKLAHQLGLEAPVLQDAFIARGHDQPLHADGAVLKEPTDGLHLLLRVTETCARRLGRQTVSQCIRERGTNL